MKKIYCQWQDSTYVFASVVLKFTEAFAEDMVSLSISSLHLTYMKYKNNMNTPFETNAQITVE